MTVAESKTVKIGDVVRFNSGGSKMTVTQVENNMLAVVYFDLAGIIQSKGGLDYALFTLVTKEKIDANLL